MSEFIKTKLQIGLETFYYGDVYIDYDEKGKKVVGDLSSIGLTEEDFFMVEEYSDLH